MRLSVALGAYNGSAYLAAQLDSLLGQTRRPDELVASDDASTDDTASVLRRFAAAAPFPVRVLVNETNRGTSRNFERAIGECQGDVIFLCDQDDVWESQKLGRFAAAFAADPGVGLVASDLAVVGPDGAALGRRVWADLGCGPADQAAIEAGNGPRLWLRNNTVTGAAAAVRAALRDVLLPIPPEWPHDSWIAFLTGAMAGVRLIRDPLTRYRVHAGQQIGSSPRTLAGQIRAARLRDAAYFTRTAACFDAAADRLEAFRDRVRDPGLIALTRARADFARTQSRMRQGGRLTRLLPAARALARGEYRAYGRGWSGFAADVML